MGTSKEYFGILLDFNTQIVKVYMYFTFNLKKTLEFVCQKKFILYACYLAITVEPKVYWYTFSQYKNVCLHFS